MARLRKKKTKAAKSLIQDPNFGKAIYLAREAEKHGLEHPKLKKVTDIIKKNWDKTVKLNCSLTDMLKMLTKNPQK